MLVVLLSVMWMLHASAQTEIDISGEWVGIIEWDYDSHAEPGAVHIYRFNVAQSGDEIMASHWTDGDDVLVTTHPDFYHTPERGGFGGTLQDSLLKFEGVPVFMGHCSIEITLQHAEVGESAVLVGEWQPTPLVLPEREGTPDPNAPDIVVGCATPHGGSIVLRRFDV
jgi:hypothetical protein